MTAHPHYETLQRIDAALQAASEAIEPFRSGSIDAQHKAGHGPVTAADAAVDAALRRILPLAGEGWLSEESVDDLSRLHCSRVWVVDPLDGTKEFVKGIPEFCISIALVEDGIPVAGGILNPATGESFLGALDSGVTYNGKRAHPRMRTTLDGATVLASRSEFERGEWNAFKAAPFAIRPMGSVAYKLALVAVGLADATFTLTPKHIWDVAAGIALVNSAGGIVRILGAMPFPNGSSLLVAGLLGSAPHIAAELSVLIDTHRPSRPETPTTLLL
jgi:myo-inositol-1(or 4)-monophosphatase